MEKDERISLKKSLFALIKDMEENGSTAIGETEKTILGAAELLIKLDYLESASSAISTYPS